MTQFRESKKNMRVFTESPTFVKDLNEMIKSTGATVNADDVRQPKYNYEEYKETTLDSFLRANYSKEMGDKNMNWWLAKTIPYAKTSYWDLISTCKIGEKKGIVLFQSKNYINELIYLGNPRLQAIYHKEALTENDINITKAIDEANKGINKAIKGVKISTANCYQLSNWVANAWWLAENGIPTVLVCNGFLNKNGENYQNHIPFATDSDWKNMFKAVAIKAGVDKILDKWVNCGNESFITISTSTQNKNSK